MKNTTSLNIRVVSNGYVASVASPYAEFKGQEHVFVDAASLAAFVTQFYAENHPRTEVEKAQAAIQAMANQALISQRAAVSKAFDPEHNPDNLTPEQVGVADGWRLLRKSEISQNRVAPMREIEQWQTDHSKWCDGGYFGCESDYSYRTKVPYGQLDAEGASK